MTLTWCQNKLLCILEDLDLYIKTYTSKEHWESLQKKMSQGDAGGLFKKICQYNCFKRFNFILSASRVKLLSWRRTSYKCFDLLLFANPVWTVIKETPINLHLHSLSPSQSCLSFIYLVNRKT